MASGSLKDTSRALNNAFSTEEAAKGLPSAAEDAIQAFLQKHDKIDEADSQRLHEELLELHSKHVAAEGAKLATFIQALIQFRPAIVGQRRLQEWWYLVVDPVVNGVGHRRVDLKSASDFALTILDYDADGNSDADNTKISGIFVKALLSAYFKRTKVQDASEAQLTSENEFVAHQLERIIVSFGKRKPKDLMLAVDRYVVDQDHRLQALGLLCTFLRYQPPHVHMVSQTSLVEHLLKCLMIDTSTTVISLALTTLIMFLPHIPNSVVTHLPHLFLIYSRLLCWERFSPSSTDDDKQAMINKENDEDDPDTETENGETSNDDNWEKLHSSFDNAESNAPELLHYFSFLYGLYPLNFLSYIRKPRRYLKNIQFPRADEFDLDQSIIRKRTEQFRRLHLLHPNFYNTTVEEELTNERWLKSDASDVVTECMSLCVAQSDNIKDPALAPTRALPPLPSLQPLLSQADSTPDMVSATKEEDSFLANRSSSPADGRSISSLHDMESVTAASQDGDVLSSLSLQKSGDTTSSLPPPEIHSEIPKSSEDRITSPILAFSPSSNRQSQILASAPRRESMSSFNSATEDSVKAELTHSSDATLPHSDSARPPSRSHMYRSPAIRIVPQSEANMAFLQREVMLLRNDLNFERYLKQQHLSHIGQLQRRNIKEATIAADTQNLINNNRILKAKLMKAHESYSALKKEASTGRSHSKKWESDLTAQIKELREKERRWETDRIAFELNTQKLRKDNEQLQTIVVDSESRELLSQQQISSLELKLEQADSLHDKLKELEERCKGYEQERLSFERACAEKDILTTELATAGLQLESKNNENERIRVLYTRQIDELKKQLEDAAKDSPQEVGSKADNNVATLIENALATSNTKYLALKKEYASLKHSYVDLEIRCQELEMQVNTQNGAGSDSLQSPGSSSLQALRSRGKFSLSADVVSPLSSGSPSLSVRSHRPANDQSPPRGGPASARGAYGQSQYDHLSVETEGSPLVHSVTAPGSATEYPFTSSILQRAASPAASAPPGLQPMSRNMVADSGSEGGGELHEERSGGALDADPADSKNRDRSGANTNFRGRGGAQMSAKGKEKDDSKGQKKDQRTPMRKSGSSSGSFRVFRSSFNS